MLRKTKQIAPKVVKHFTPWWLRWLYSIYGERVVNMATATIHPNMMAANIPDSSDNVVWSFWYYRKITLILITRLTDRENKNFCVFFSHCNYASAGEKHLISRWNQWMPIDMPQRKRLLRECLILHCSQPMRPSSNTFYKSAKSMNFIRWCWLW